MSGLSSSIHSETFTTSLPPSILSPRGQFSPTIMVDVMNKVRSFFPFANRGPGGQRAGHTGARSHKWTVMRVVRSYTVDWILVIALWCVVKACRLMALSFVVSSSPPRLTRDTDVYLNFQYP